MGGNTHIRGNPPGAQKNEGGGTQRRPPLRDKGRGTRKNFCPKKRGGGAPSRAKTTPKPGIREQKPPEREKG